MLASCSRDLIAVSKQPQLLKEIFPDRLYVNLQDPSEAEHLSNLAGQLRLPTVVTHPIYYLTPEQARLQRTLAAVRLGKTITNLPKDAAALQPDLVLMDIEMPRLNGLEALSRIKLNSPGTRVVMLTVSDNDEHILAAVQMGADGYLVKDLNSRKFLECIGSLEQGNLAVTRKTATRLISGFQNLLKHDSVEKDVLSCREVAVLALVGEGLSTSEIGQRLYISENTVKYHVRNILQKLGVHNRAEAISHALQKGLIEPR